jgi:hypothetical protein
MLEDIRRRVETGNYWFTIHGFERCVERGIAPEEVKYAIMQGEIMRNIRKTNMGRAACYSGKQ